MSKNQIIEILKPLFDKEKILGLCLNPEDAFVIQKFRNGILSHPKMQKGYFTFCLNDSDDAWTYNLLNKFKIDTKNVQTILEEIKFRNFK